MPDSDNTDTDTDSMPWIDTPEIKIQVGHSTVAVSSQREWEAASLLLSAALDKHDIAHSVEGLQRKLGVLENAHSEKVDVDSESQPSPQPESQEDSQPDSQPPAQSSPQKSEEETEQEEESDSDDVDSEPDPDSEQEEEPEQEADSDSDSPSDSDDVASVGTFSPGDIVRDLDDDDYGRGTVDRVNMKYDTIVVKFDSGTTSARTPERLEHLGSAQENETESARKLDDAISEHLDDSEQEEESDDVSIDTVRLGTWKYKQGVALLHAEEPLTAKELHQTLKGTAWERGQSSLSGTLAKLADANVASRVKDTSGYGYRYELTPEGQEHITECESEARTDSDVLTWSDIQAAWTDTHQEDPEPEPDSEEESDSDDVDSEPDPDTEQEGDDDSLSWQQAHAHESDSETESHPTDALVDSTDVDSDADADSGLDVLFPDDETDSDGQYSEALDKAQGEMSTNAE